ncbi:hypothetical protein EDD11_007432 [Mortierella claussenii]|nr:hypothetical protein EDD11_007432 [Mortierella claussenii]
MTEQTSAHGPAGTNNPDVHAHHPNFVEKIVDKITGKHHHSDHGTGSVDRQQHSQQHQYGGRDNEHDNAYAAEATLVGAHAIPPMTTHADPNHRNEQLHDQARAQRQAQTIAPPPQQPQSTVEPFQEYGDRMAGLDYRSANTERQHPLM